MHADRYSRMVGLLKIFLPLLALGILSSLFLISRAVTPPVKAPFADTEVQQRLTNQQVTGPFFSGTTVEGDQIDFVAHTVTRPDGKTGINRGENVDVEIDLVGGTHVTVTADEGEMNIANDLTDLIGNVVITTSQGYVMNSEFLKIRMSALEVTSPGHVTGTASFGELEAGSMRLVTPEGATDSQLFFADGVKLIYYPSATKE